MTLATYIQKAKNSTYLKAGVWAIGAEILVRAVAFLATPIFTRILPQDVYGDVRTFESWLNIWAPLLSLGLFTNIEVAQYRYKDQFEEYTGSVMLLIVLLGAAFGSLAFLFREQLCRLLDYTGAMLAIVVLYSAFYSCILVRMRYHRIRLAYKRVTLLSMLASVPALLIAVAACLAATSRGVSGHDLLDVRVISFYAPILCIGIVVFSLVVMRGKVRPNTGYWRYAVQQSAPLIMYQISLQILTQSDRIMVKSFVSSSAAAIFSVATTVIYIVEILHRGFESAWIPWFYARLDKRDFATAGKAIVLVMVGFAAIFVPVLLAGREIILVLGGFKYLEAIWLLGPMLGGVLFQFLMLKLADIEKFYDRSSAVGVISIVVAVVNVGLNYAAIQVGGYMAVSYTTMISYFIAVCLHLPVVRRVAPELTRHVLVAMAACGVLCGFLVLGMSVYALPNVLRWVLIAAFAAAAAVAALKFMRTHKA
ncbi:MAG: oligosaccharide flippase family protein [Coriobacteriales bacterium]|nr:oligosaccharide flippase family protein [Coriobacteriales bacterium]